MMREWMMTMTLAVMTVLTGTVGAEQVFNFPLADASGTPELKNVPMDGGKVEFSDGAAVFKNATGQHRRGGVLRIPGTAGKLDCSKAGDAITVSLWVKPEKFGDNMGLVACADPGNKGGWMLNIAHKGELRITACGSFGHRQTKTPLEIGKWQHVAFTWDVGNKEGIHFYLNGKPAPISLGYIGTAPCAKGTVDWVIGANTGGNNQPFAGAIKNLRVFDEVLTPEAIAKLGTAN